MPRLTTESFGQGDHTWLGSDHGQFNGQTGTLDVSAFTKATHYPNGYFPAGLMVNVANLAAVAPFTGAAGEKLGFLLFDIATDGVTDVPAAFMLHGLIRTANLPVKTNLPATAPAGFIFK